MTAWQQRQSPSPPERSAARAKKKKTGRVISCSRADRFGSLVVGTACRPRGCLQLGVALRKLSESWLGLRSSSWFSFYDAMPQKQTLLCLQQESPPPCSKGRSFFCWRHGRHRIRAGAGVALQGSSAKGRRFGQEDRRHRFAFCSESPNYSNGQCCGHLLGGPNG